MDSAFYRILFYDNAHHFYVCRVIYGCAPNSRNAVPLDSLPRVFHERKQNIFNKFYQSDFRQQSKSRIYAQHFKLAHRCPNLRGDDGFTRITLRVRTCEV